MEIFRTLVELYGYPGDQYEDWVELLHKGRPLLTQEESDKADDLFAVWGSGLQASLRRMDPDPGRRWRYRLNSNN